MSEKGKKNGSRLRGCQNANNYKYGKRLYRLINSITAQFRALQEIVTFLVNKSEI